MFHGRAWPEGFKFPACGYCNDASTKSEQVVAMLSLVWPDPRTESEEDEIIRAMQGLKNNQPALVDELLEAWEGRGVGETDTMVSRRIARKMNLTLAPGMTYADLGVVKANGPLLSAAMDVYARKLLCALYYLYSGGVIVCRDSAMSYVWFSNAQGASSEVPTEIMTPLMASGSIIRSNQFLGDQFSVEYAMSDDKNDAVFRATFRQAFMIIGFVRRPASQLKELLGHQILKVFDPSSSQKQRC